MEARPSLYIEPHSPPLPVTHLRPGRTLHLQPDKRRSERGEYGFFYSDRKIVLTFVLMKLLRGLKSNHFSIHISDIYRTQIYMDIGPCTYFSKNCVSDK